MARKTAIIESVSTVKSSEITREIREVIMKKAKSALVNGDFLRGEKRRFSTSVLYIDRG